MQNLTDEQKSKKTRLITFFRKHAPGDIYKVDILMSSSDTEEKIFSDLRTKYKVSESADALSSDAADLRQRLSSFYGTYAPTDLAKVETALQMNLTEGQLFAALYQKYNVPVDKQTFHKGSLGNHPAAGQSAAASPPQQQQQRSRAGSRASLSGGTPVNSKSNSSFSGRDSFRRKLVDVYTIVCPTEVEQKVQHAMSLSVPEDAILQKIYEKYNLDANGKPKAAATPAVEPAQASPEAAPAAPTTPSAAEVSQVTPAAPSLPPPQNAPADEPPERASMRQRLRSFYAIHAPNEVETKVTTAMGLGLQEDALFDLLGKKYGSAATLEVSQSGSSMQPSSASAVQPAVASPAPLARDYANGPGSLEERLTAFYQTFNPAEAAVKVPKALSLKIPEAELWGNLYRTYGLDSEGRPLAAAPASPPPQPSAPNVSPDNSVPEGNAAKAALEVKLRRFYAVYAPDSVEQKVAAALSRDKSEQELFMLLSQKYQLSFDEAISIGNNAVPANKAGPARGTDNERAAPPSPEVSIDAAFGSSPPRDVDLDELRTRLTAFFTRYDKDADVEGRVRDSLDVVASGHMTQDELVRFVEQQYGPALELRVDNTSVLPKPPKAPPRTASVVAPSGSPATAALSPSSSVSIAGDRGALRQRLQSFYKSQGVAEAGPKIDYALSLEADDDTVMQRVMSKYNVTTEPPLEPTAPLNAPASPALTSFVQSPPRVSSVAHAPVPQPLFASPLPNASGITDPARTSPLSQSLERKRSVTFSDLGLDAHDDAKNKRRERLRSRLVSFYQRYNPGNIDKVDIALTLDIPEDILFSKLYEKYNLDANGEPLQVGGALRRFERQSSPELLAHQSSSVASVLPPRVPSAGASTFAKNQSHKEKELMDRMFIVYARYYPSVEAQERAQRVSFEPGESVNDAVQRVTKELEAAQRGGGLPAVQDPSETPAEVVQPAGVSQRSADLKERLVRFYERHRPSEVPRVDSVLAAPITEEQIWDRLQERYGLEAVAPFRFGAEEPDFPSDPAILSRVLSGRSTKEQRTSPPSSVGEGRSRSTKHVAGPALDRLVDRVAVESEDPMTTLDYVTDHVGHSSTTPQAALADVPKADARAVSFLVRLPEVSMFLLRKATSQQRTDFVASLEKDVRSFAQLAGAVGVSCDTVLSPNDDLVCMRYVALFPSTIGAQRFRTLVIDTSQPSAVVPLPATRAAYLLIGGNVHAVREGRVSGAVFTDEVPPSLQVAMRTSATAAAQRTTAGAPGESNYYRPGVVPSEQYDENVEGINRRLSMLDVDSNASPMLASIRLRQQRGNGETFAPNDRILDEALGGEMEPGSSGPVLSWGDVMRQPAASTAPAALREQDLLARERALQAQSLELKDRQRVLQERESSLRDAEARIRASQDDEREANRLRRERAAEASMRFESLAVRESELKERERQLMRHEEELNVKERDVAANMSELSQRAAFLDERERRVTLRERQLEESERCAPARSSSRYSDGTEAGIYIADLETKLREAKHRISVLEGAPSAAVALQAQQHSSQHGERDLDLRLRHVIEREQLVADAEARLQRTTQEAISEVRHEDEGARRRWEELRRQDRELLARRLEIEAMHSSVQRAQQHTNRTLSAGTTQSSPPSSRQAAGTSSTPPRSLFTSPRDDTLDVKPNPSFTFGASRESAGLLRQDDISTMLLRVKERETLLRKMSERMTPARTVLP